MTTTSTSTPPNTDDEEGRLKAPPPRDRLSTGSTEASPLSPYGPKIMFSRRSSAAKILNFFRFSIDQSDYDPVVQGQDGDDDDDDDNLPTRRIAHKSSKPFWIGSLLFVVLIVASFLVVNQKASGDNHATSLPKAEADTCMDPIMSLKEASSLEGLANGAVAADHIVCSQVGNSILQQDGNAVDAAVATVLCLGVANPASSGLGGGAFILVHSDRANLESKDTGSFPEFHDARDADAPIGQTKITEVIDCRETAPGDAHQGMYEGKEKDASTIGGLAVAVPGELRGLELAHARHGRLTWATVVEPAIKLAREGVLVSPHLAHDIQNLAIVKILTSGPLPKLRRYLTKDDNWDHYLKEGELLKNPKLAETLEAVAKQGASVLYNGELAQTLVEEVQAAGGILSTADMADYHPTIRSPLSADVNGLTLVGVPPPSSGGATVIGAARFLAGYQTPLANAADTLSIHRMVEAMRHAFAIRMSLSDPAFHTDVTLAAVHDLMTGPYMKNLRENSKDNSTLPLSMYGGEKWAQLQDHDGKVKAKDHQEGDRRSRRLGVGSESRRLTRPFGYLEDSGTSHLSVVDKDGNAVAITTSVNNIFGSFVFSETTGVLMGNTMDDFGVPGRSNYYGLKPSEANFVAPGKKVRISTLAYLNSFILDQGSHGCSAVTKPLSSMSPTMVFRREDAADEDDWGKLMLVVGGSGGPKIITSVLQVLINYCLLGMPLFESVARPRVHEQLVYHESATTTTEKALLDQGPLIAVSERTKNALLSRGHASLLDVDYAGTVQAIAVDLETNTLSAVSDIRKGGTPAGY
jgi:gamma-glutamyltranspeptidase